MLTIQSLENLPCNCMTINESFITVRAQEPGFLSNLCHVNCSQWNRCVEYWCPCIQSRLLTPELTILRLYRTSIEWSQTLASPLSLSSCYCFNPVLLNKRKDHNLKKFSVLQSNRIDSNDGLHENGRAPSFIGWITLSGPIWCRAIHTAIHAPIASELTLFIWTGKQQLLASIELWESWKTNSDNMIINLCISIHLSLGNTL